MRNRKFIIVDKGKKVRSSGTLNCSISSGGNASPGFANVANWPPEARSTTRGARGLISVIVYHKDLQRRLADFLEVKQGKRIEQALQEFDSLKCSDAHSNAN